MSESGFSSFSVNNLGGGLVTSLSPVHIIDTAVQRTDNFDFSSRVGTARTRDGYTLFTQHSSSPPSGTVYSLYDYVYNGASKLVASFGGVVYDVGASASDPWTTIYNVGYTGRVPMTTFKGYHIFLDSMDNPPRKRLGHTTTTTALGGSPPTDGVDIEVFRERLWIASRSTLYYSAIGNPEDWTTPGENGAGSFKVAQDDGDRIMRIVAFNTVLLIFKQRSVYALTGSKPSNFIVRRVVGTVGTVAADSVQRAEAFVLFLARDGVYAFGDGVFAMMSKNISRTIVSDIDYVNQYVSSGIWANRYFLNAGNPGAVRTTYVLDYVNGVWYTYSNFPYGSAVVRSSDGALYLGSGTVGKVYKYGGVSYDETTSSPVSASFRTKEFWASGWHHPKRRIVAYVLWSSESVTSYITVSLNVNGQPLPGSMSSTVTNPDTGKLVVSRFVFPSSGSYARTFSLNVSATAQNLPVEVYGVSMEFEEEMAKRATP